jgi:hypothetical protein
MAIPGVLSGSEAGRPTAVNATNLGSVIACMIGAGSIIVRMKRSQQETKLKE